MKRIFRYGIPAALVLAFVLAGAAQSGAKGKARSAAGRPNVVVVMTDDQTVESMRVMKNVRRLIAGQGTTFTNSFVSFPLCCPSRATFLTGQYSHNTGVVGNNFATGYSRFDQSNTLAVWLDAAGYTTAFVGKYLNDYGKSATSRFVPPGWDDWHAAVRVNYYRHSMLENGRITYYATAAKDYSSDVYTERALDVLRRHARSSRPFFLWLSYFAPHEGTPVEKGDPPGLLTPVPARRHKNRFSGMDLPRWPSLNERDVSDKPRDIRRRPLLSPERLSAVREKYQQRLESLLAVDEGVAKVVAELRRLGELKRTVIIFTSDNGFLEGQHRVASGKEMVYEPSIRVPLIMRGPGVPKRMRLPQVVANVDLAPTILQLARATPGLAPDGRSFWPLFRDPGQEWGRDLLLERGPGGRNLGDRLYTALRTSRYLFVEHATGEHELYDLNADRFELRNLYDRPAYKPIEAELAERLVRLRECVGQFCRVGPALSFSVAYTGACASSPLEARVTGGDERYLEYVEFFVNGRRSRDALPPFERLVQPGAAQAGARLRALGVLEDGRRVTIDRAVPGC